MMMMMIICDSISGQKYYAKVSRKEMKVQEFMYKDKMNMKCDTCVIDHLSNNRSNQKVTKGLKKIWKVCQINIQ
jgi:hypothetical protein